MVVKKFINTVTKKTVNMQQISKVLATTTDSKKQRNNVPNKETIYRINEKNIKEVSFLPKKTDKNDDMLVYVVCESYML